MSPNEENNDFVFPKLLTPEEVAEKFNIKLATLRSYIFKKKIPYYKVNRLIRFSEKDLEVWLNFNKVPLEKPENKNK